jgi:3-carboxy-cis,cis-muconate cycloisomerase
MADALLGRMFGAPEMQAIFGERGRLQGMLDFEAALARVEARLGLIPAAAAAPIVQCCRAERFDLEQLGRDAPLSGNTAIPMVRHLKRLVAAQDAAAAPYVHWGATSQDAMDTGLVLQMRAGGAWLQAELRHAADAAAEQARRHRATAMAGRTWLQQAVPITFGLKAAGWLDALRRHQGRWGELAPRILALQFGGAAGTLASLGERGLEVAGALAAELQLALPDLPWHAHRDRIAETGATLALLTGTLGKIARDVSLLMQTEVGEAQEPAAPGKGSSSAMPHKRNPVACALVLAAAVRAPGLAATLLAAMPQEHERGLGGWHAEWTALPELFDLAAGALAQTRHMIAGLEVDVERMGANLQATQGQLLAEAAKMALAPHLGGAEAATLVEQACTVAAEQRKHLRAVLGTDPRVGAALSPSDLERLFDPARYLGVSDAFVARALAAHGKD